MKKSLDRFLIAQQNYYYDAYTELKAGKKRKPLDVFHISPDSWPRIQ